MAAGELARLARVVVANAAADMPSPCVSVCRMDARRGLCIGCCRTLEEIAGWSRMDDASKREVWRRIVQRAEEPQS
jgi:predicted Fe-S protein YdhL (DUF1289 family)